MNNKKEMLEILGYGSMNPFKHLPLLRQRQVIAKLYDEHIARLKIAKLVVEKLNTNN